MNVSVFLVTNWPFLFSLSQIFLVKTSKGPVIIFLGEQTGDHRKLWKDSERGPLKFSWKMKTWLGGGGGGESRKSSNVIQWSKIQRGDRLNFTLFSPKSSTLSPLPPQAIDNDRSLSEALLWRLFGIELFTFFFPSDLITSQSSTLYWISYFRFLGDQKASKSSKPPRLYQSFQQPQQAFENVYLALCFCSQAIRCILVCLQFLIL